jgi:hypothetical protein
MKLSMIYLATETKLTLSRSEIQWSAKIHPYETINDISCN